VGGVISGRPSAEQTVRNYFYDTMTYAEPGDLVVSFKVTLVQTIGIIHGNGYESPKAKSVQSPVGLVRYVSRECW
jgi:hypothetical protein